MVEQNGNYIKKNINITPNQKFKLEMYCLENNTNCSALIRDFIDGLVIQEEERNVYENKETHPNQIFFNFDEKSEGNFEN